jgi:hypothetical protein
MTDEIIPVQPDGHKKRGRPPGSKNKQSTPRPKPEPKPKAPRPGCETSELAKYKDNEKYVIWGVQPECPRFKRKGIAVLYNPEHKGGQVTLMPVTDDGGTYRWRYRGVPGPCPFRYEKLDLEPSMAFSLPDILEGLAKAIRAGTTEWFGTMKEAVKTTEVFMGEKKKDGLDEAFKKLGTL